MRGIFNLSHRTRSWLVAVGVAIVPALVLALPPMFGWIPLSLEYDDLISAAGFLLTVLVLFFSVVPSVISMADTARSAHYSQLDSMYADLLKLGVEQPHLRHPELGLTDAQRRQYDSYAYMIWNFVETVRDRCADDPELREIWGPVIATEYKSHGDWFLAETRPYLSKSVHKFRLAFADFVWRNFAAEGATGLASDGKQIAEKWKCRSADVIRHDDAVSDFLRKDAGLVVTRVEPPAPPASGPDHDDSSPAPIGT